MVAGEIPISRKGVTAIPLGMWLKNSLLSYEGMRIYAINEIQYT